MPTRIPMPSERTRAYIYRLLTAALLVAAVKGVISKEDVIVYGAFFASALGLGLAAANTSTTK